MGALSMMKTPLRLSGQHLSTASQQAIWLVEFQKVENKSTTGIDERVIQMIKRWYVGETLLVGKPEHKAAIEKELEIPCRCDEAAMEVMWGVENLLHILVPKGGRP
nr:uncharacterized protein LOC117862424 [Setaria viridis]